MIDKDDVLTLSVFIAGILVFGVVLFDPGLIADVWRFMMGPR